MAAWRKAYLEITLISKATIDEGHVYSMELVNVQSISMLPTIKTRTFLFLNMKSKTVETSGLSW